MDKNTNNKKSRAKNIILIIVFLLLESLFVVATASLVWGGNYYGNITIDEIIFHLSMPIAGTATYILEDYAMSIIPWIRVMLIVNLIVILIYFFAYKAKTKSKFNVFLMKAKNVFLHWNWTAFVVWLVVLVFMCNNYFELFTWIKGQALNSNFIEENYVDATKISITFPEEKRNLIHIYIESAETSHQDKNNGGVWDINYVPEMTELAKNNVSFSHSDKLEGATVAPACGWTIAGLVAQTSGVPLKLAKYEDGLKGLDNSMDKYATFLPGATTMGDILSNAGYKNYFMAGSDFAFGGRTNYFKNHGNYEIFDYYTAIEKEKIPSSYKEWWGFEDQKLYEYAKEQLLEISKSGEPFNFSMLTADTHHEDGYVCQLCQDEYGSNQYANVWNCASKQLDEFIAWCQEQDFYENTTIVITGDHCSMDSDFYNFLAADKHAGSTERKIYNCFINSSIQPVKETNRLFTTMDYFPTILASLGAEIEGNRIGLGTNLFSDQQTLAEQYGYDYMFDELNKKSTFYNHELLYK